MPDGAVIELELDDLPQTHHEQSSASSNAVEVLADATTLPVTLDHGAEDSTELQQGEQSNAAGSDSSSASSAETTPVDAVRDKSKSAVTTLRVLFGLATFILAALAADWTGWTSAQAFRSDCWEQRVGTTTIYLEALLTCTLVCTSRSWYRMQTSIGAGAASTTTAISVPSRSSSVVASDEPKFRYIYDGSGEIPAILSYWLVLYRPCSITSAGTTACRFAHQDARI